MWDSTTLHARGGAVRAGPRQQGDRRVLLLFDLDGTLIDSVADIATASNALRAEYGLPPLPLAAVAVP